MGAKERKEKIDKRYGWLASLVSSSVVSGFMVLKSIFQIIFNILTALVD